MRGEYLDEILFAVDLKHALLERLTEPEQRRFADQWVTQRAVYGCLNQCFPFRPMRFALEYARRAFNCYEYAVIGPR